MLGWVLLGGNNKENIHLIVINLCLESKIGDLLKPFWQIESYSTSEENPESYHQKQSKKLSKYQTKPLIKKNRDIT